jgi:hypothetical protein
MKRSEIIWSARISIEFYEILKKYGSPIYRRKYVYQLNDRYINVENSYEGFLLNCESPVKLLYQIKHNSIVRRAFFTVIKDVRGMFDRNSSIIPINKSLVKR